MAKVRLNIIQNGICTIDNPGRHPFIPEIITNTITPITKSTNVERTLENGSSSLGKYTFETRAPCDIRDILDFESVD
jgi:hypothetical protein